MRIFLKSIENIWEYFWQLKSKIFLFQAIQFSQIVPIQLIEFSISTGVLY